MRATMNEDVVIHYLSRMFETLLPTQRLGVTKAGCDKEQARWDEEGKWEEKKHKM